jgi:hypothetical protein
MGAYQLLIQMMLGRKSTEETTKAGDKFDQGEPGKK